MTMKYDNPTAIRIRDFLIAQGMTTEGAYGMMANLYVESGFRSNNAQNSCMKRLGMTDESYTAKVDNCTYKNFTTDRVGYGICQWTSSGRKTGLLSYAKAQNVSISDETMQLNYLIKELKTSYKNVWNLLITSHDISECAKYVMTKFERPANQSEVNQNIRASYGVELYNDLSKSGAKDNNTLEIKQCFLTNNRCYKQGKKIAPKGIIVHSTGANNPNLKRYIQPDDGILGKNSLGNHWNTPIPSKCVHAFIGKDKNGVVRIYQTLPWNYRCWGCGSGKKGSYNNSYIQFEIAEDALTDIKYFNEAFNLAIELCAYLAKLYNIPNSNIISHKEANKRGYASNHGDCDHWLKKFGRNMDWFRSQVIIKCSNSNTDTSLAISSNSSTKSSVNYIYQGLDYSLVFNPTYYSNAYSDLKRHFGNDATKLFNHFCQYGMMEGRQASNNFNVIVYKNKYTDLQEAFGNDLPKYYEHWIEFGHKEGRSAV